MGMLLHAVYCIETRESSLLGEKKQTKKIGQNARRFDEVCLSLSHSCCMAFLGSLYPNESVFAAIERAQKGLFISDNYHTPLLFFHLFYSYFIQKTNI